MSEQIILRTPFSPSGDQDWLDAALQAWTAHASDLNMAAANRFIPVQGPDLYPPWNVDADTREWYTEAYKT